MGASPILWFDIEWMVDREGEALAEPRRVLARRPPEALIGPPAVADLTVGLGSGGPSPSRVRRSPHLVWNSHHYSESDSPVGLRPIPRPERGPST
jgi:hypothetical protein